MLWSGDGGGRDEVHERGHGCVVVRWCGVAMFGDASCVGCAARREHTSARGGWLRWWRGETRQIVGGGRKKAQGVWRPPRYGRLTADLPVVPKRRRRKSYRTHWRR